jgi:hypothetical protein
MKKIRYAFMACAAIFGIGKALAQPTTVFYYVNPNGDFIYERITDVVYAGGTCEEALFTYCGYMAYGASALQPSITSNTLQQMMLDGDLEPFRGNRRFVPEE